MSIAVIAILAIVQGLAELLPVSSSAHVIVAERLLGLDPSSPEMTFLLVMLHTGTMFAVLLYFGRRWMTLLKTSSFIRSLIVATVCTGALGLALKKGIEMLVPEVEDLFRMMPLIAGALFAAGVLILVSSRRKAVTVSRMPSDQDSVKIGLVQGLCLPFRGFSRSGATISTGLILGLPRQLCEELSFALAVVLTPPVIVLELRRLAKANALLPEPIHFHTLLVPGLIGMVFSFLAGLVALRWLSSWLEKGRWAYFGYYCIAFSAAIFLFGHF